MTGHLFRSVVLVVSGLLFPSGSRETLQDTFDPASAAGMVSSGAGPLATAAAEPEDLKVLRAYLIDNKVDTAEAAKELGVTIAANNNALVNKNAFQKYYGQLS